MLTAFISFAKASKQGLDGSFMKFHDSIASDERIIFALMLVATELTHDVCMAFVQEASSLRNHQKKCRELSARCHSLHETMVTAIDAVNVSGL